MIIPRFEDDAKIGAPDRNRLLSNGWPAAWIADDPDAAITSPEAVYKAARAYVASGLSVVPIDACEANKSPDPRRLRSWKIYQLRPPREDELRGWYDRGGPFGLAVLGGGVSGGARGYGLEIIDFDTVELATPWAEQVELRAPGLIGRLVQVQSPRPGLHVYYRCQVFSGCQKLACAGSGTDAVPGQPKKITLVELKGEGGYCLVPPSPRRCHPRNRLYRLVDGSAPLTHVPIISPEERNILLEEARRFNRWTEPVLIRQPHPVKAVNSDGNRPGDDFARRVSWADILMPHGWVLVRQRGDIEDWRRPGKSDGISGTVNYAGSGLFYAFSTNAHPFEEGRGYNKFQAYAVLNHDGDFAKSAQALKSEGYGLKALSAGKRTGDSTVMTTVMRLGEQSGGVDHV